MRGKEKQAPADLKVAVVETFPKIAVEIFLQPAFDTEVPLKCSEGSLQSLFTDLKQHNIDLILSDQPVSIGETKGIFVHPLGQSKLAFFAASELYSQYAHCSPEELNDAPVILPTEASPLRRAGDDWFFQHGITPKIVAQCSDSGLIKAMAAAGRGLFIAPLNIRLEIEQATNCKVISALENFEERYYAITIDKKIEHPTVGLIVDSARTALALN